MESQSNSYPASGRVSQNHRTSGKGSNVTAPDKGKKGKLSRKRNLENMAKKNGMREKIIMDVMDDDISRVDHISEIEMNEYNKDYQDFLEKTQNNEHMNPMEKVMVANIQDYLKFSNKGEPAMVYYSTDLKIPLLTLKKGNRVKPHSDMMGIYSVLEGKGSIQIGMKTYKVGKGSLIHVPKGIVRAIHCEDDLKIMAIHVS